MEDLWTPRDWEQNDIGPTSSFRLYPNGYDKPISRAFERVKVPRILVVQGEFGCGKSTIVGACCNLGLGHVVKKDTSPAPHPLYKASASFRDWLLYKGEAGPILEGLICPVTPTVEWYAAAHRLGIRVPNEEEVASVADQFIAAFWLRRVFRVFRQACRTNKTAMWELSAKHTFFLYIFLSYFKTFNPEDFVVVKLNVDERERTRRVLSRQYCEDPHKNDVIGLTRALAGAVMLAEIALIPDPYTVHERSNMNWIEFEHNVQFIQSICE